MASETSKALAGGRPAPARQGTAATPGGDTPRDAAIAAAAQISRGEPENAARAADAAAGSTLDAPGVGSGPAGRAGQIEAAAHDIPLRGTVLDAAAGRLSGLPGEHIAGVDQILVDGPAGAAPGIFDTLGSHGPQFSQADLIDARDQRRARLAADLRRAPLTGSKLAATMPQDQEALDDYLAAGFDFVVVSRQDGRRRAGVLHPSVATLRRSGDFQKHELEALRRDPMLVIHRIR